MKKADGARATWLERARVEFMGEDFELYVAVSTSLLLAAMGIVAWGWCGRPSGPS
jgi:hypothetical protein